MGHEFKAGDGPDGEDHDAYKRRVEREENNYVAEACEKIGITVETFEAAVPLVHEGRGGCDGVDVRETRLQIIALVLAAFEAGEKQTLSRSEFLKRLAKAPPGDDATRTRFVIDVGLRLMAVGLEQLLQTSHPRVSSGGISGVATLLLNCYAEPTPFNRSDLSQAVKAFLQGK